MSRSIHYKGHEILCLPKKTQGGDAGWEWTCAVAICQVGAVVGTARQIRLTAPTVGDAREAGVAFARSLIDAAARPAPVRKRGGATRA